VAEANNSQNACEPADRARSGAPSAGRAIHDKFSADEIFQRIIASAHEEIDSPVRQLFFSGMAAGLAITLTFLAHASVKATVHGPAADLIGALLYPLGFIFIIMGRYQLYTENTLPPVALVLTRLASIPALFRVWGVVLLGNAVGAGIGAFILANTGVFDAKTAEVAAEFGLEGFHRGWWDLFFKAIFAGGLVAGLVWIDHASRDSVSRLFLIYIIIYAIPASNLHHVVVSTCDSLYVVFTGKVGFLPIIGHFVLPVFLGNTVGGIGLVTVVNYAQTKEPKYAELDGEKHILSLSEMIFGRKRPSASK